MSPYLGPNEGVSVSVDASDKIAVFSNGRVDVFETKSYTNYPRTSELVLTADGSEVVSSAFSAATTLYVQAGAEGAFYEIGTAPVIQSLRQNPYQGAPASLDSTGTLTITQLLSGIVTSSTAAGVTATLPTGTLTDNGSSFSVNDSFDWAVVNTGPNTFTLQGGTGHTLVGSGAVPTANSCTFRTRKTAANTFVTYRIA